QYSETGNDFTEHYISSSSTARKALMVHPNLEFNRQTCTMADFHRVATVPLTATDGFVDVEILTSEIAAQNSGDKLTELPLSHCKLDISTMLMHENTLVAAIESLTPSTPYPLIPAGKKDSVGSKLRTITIDVYLNINGNTERTTRTMKSAKTIESLIARYMFYPDPRAYLMAISDNETTYLLPLTMHEKIYGAYWHGGTGIDYLPEPANDYDRNTATEIPVAKDMRSILLISAKDQPMVFDSANACSFTQSAITALCPATKAPRSGVFGRHNLYAFTADGLWMLEYYGGRIKSMQKISLRGCLGGEAIADTGETMYFVSG
ncbi:MAG: hypothetical protein K2K37_06625, partial [Muribaculaceae bacterium]|nr:hypothetical protein [Muribaculaceae bacterium]